MDNELQMKISELEARLSRLENLLNEAKLKDMHTIVSQTLYEVRQISGQK